MKKTTAIQEIQNEFEVFIKTQLQGRNVKDIEYIGINLCNCKNSKPVFKCYYTTRESLLTYYPLLTDFQRRDMIRALNKITDTSFSDRTRYEIGLKNRNDINMRWIYEWIEKVFPISDEQKWEMRQMAKLTCCDLPGYRHSALYYLGFIADNVRPIPLSAIKLHFLLRNCKDPDSIGINYRVDTIKCLSFLRASGIAPLGVLADAVGSLLNSTEGIELWMAAIDYFLQCESKYKIYLKTVGGDLFKPIKSLLIAYKLDYLFNQLDTYENWLATHPHHKLYGVAICLTSQCNWSLNLYQTLA